jgi:hypothetical protein
LKHTIARAKDAASATQFRLEFSFDRPGCGWSWRQILKLRVAVAGIGFAIGHVINGTTMTVQEANGTVVTVDLSGTTTYHGETAASPSAVQVGTGVTVQIDTAALASQTPVPSASGALGGRTLTASSILITQP